MKFILTSIMFVLAAYTAAGAQGAERASEQQSEALTVAKAAGFRKIRDVTSKDIDAAKITSSGSPVAMGTIGVATKAGAMTPAHGLSSSAAGNFALAGALLSSLPVGYAESSPRVLVWMPKELAASPEEAAEKLRELFVEAYRASLPDAQVDLAERASGKKKSQRKKYLRISSAQCADCEVFAPLLQAERLPKEGKAPEFLDGGNAYIWGRPGWKGEGLFGGYPWTLTEFSPTDRQHSLERLSANLPDWVYIFAPADAEKLAPYAQIFHQGEVLLFIQPELQEQMAQR